MYRSAIATSAIAYAVSTLTRKYVRVESGAKRSWRFQPTDRSAAMRAPEPSTAFIVPKAARPTMK
jgi:hypothetical protein